MQDARGDRRSAGRLTVAGAVVGVLLLLAALAATSSWGPLVTVLPHEPVPVETGPLATASPTPEPSGDVGEPELEHFAELPAWIGDVVQSLAAAAVIGLVGWIVLAVIRRLRPVGLGQASEASGTAVEIPDVDDEEVALTLEEALAALRTGVAVDGAVVECWRRLERTAEETGVRRQPSETAEEFTKRILAHAVVDDTALSELASLYRQALFSDHVLTDAHRERAIACIRRLTKELGQAVRRDG